MNILKMKSLNDRVIIGNPYKYMCGQLSAVLTNERDPICHSTLCVLKIKIDVSICDKKVFNLATQHTAAKRNRQRETSKQQHNAFIIVQP